MATKEIAVHEARAPAAWNPFREFRALSGMSEMFDGLFGGFPALRPPAYPNAWTPKVNIQETDKEYIITAALPGMKREDVKIKMEDGALVISGERKEEKEEKGKNWLRQEMSYGSFCRSFILPSGVHPEDIKAVQKEGVLTVTLPKLEQEKNRGINIKVE